jgi:phospholipase C
MIAPSNTPTPGENAPTATPVLSFATIEPLASPTGLPQQATGGIKTVFVIMMENHNWSEIKDSPSAPYINQVLLPQASHAEQYYNPPGIHPSEPNYLWLEAGTNFGIANDANPATNHQSTTNHLVTLLDKKGVSWKSYQEGITGTGCPLTATGLYAPKHNPMLYFDDVTGGNDAASTYCIAHVRPYSELSADLHGGGPARYNFITPDLCDDMHNSSGCASSDSVRNGDSWLASEVPAILGSSAYKDGGALFITWDEGEGRDGPIGMIILSPYAKGGGYANDITYTHSSTLRTVEEIFGLSPMLRDAANATDLSDLFRMFP